MVGLRAMLVDSLASAQSGQASETDLVDNGQMKAASSGLTARLVTVTRKATQEVLPKAWAGGRMTPRVELCAHVALPRRSRNAEGSWHTQS